MTVLDIVIIAALAVFLLAWWVRGLPARRLVLAGAALVMLAAGVANVLDDRWQGAAAAGLGLFFLIVLGVSALLNKRKETAPRGAPFVSGTLFTLLAAGPIAAIVLFPVWALPKPSGTHLVGVRTFDVTDTSRPGVLMAGPDEPRRLLVRVWYPAQNADGLKPRPYFNAAETRHTARSVGELVGLPFFFTYVKHVRTNSYEDAPLLEGARDLPVVFYSHGYTSFLSQNTALMEELASHGYVVFSVQHTFDSSATVFPDGSVAPVDPAMNQPAGDEEAREEESPQRKSIGGSTLDERFEGTLAFQERAIVRQARIAVKSAPAWLADRLFVHDTLQRSPPSSVADIAAASNLNRVGEMGMSFGGAAAGGICMVDQRCAAGINLDGGDYFFSAFNTDIPTPFLMFHSDMRNIYRAVGADLPEGTPRGFNDFSYERAGTADVRDDVYRVQLKGSQHLGLSDFSLFVGRPLRNPLFGDAPSDVIIGAQNDFVRGFFDKHVRGVANDFPAPQLAAYADWVLPTENDDLAAWWNALPEDKRAAFDARSDAIKQKMWGP